MQDVMLDLETMGTKPDAAIVAIGAVEFDTATGQVGERFYLPVQLGSSVRLGGTMDPDTVLWWMQQDEAARRELWQEDRADLATALQRFAGWIAERAPAGEVRVWGNGAAFDNVVLRTAYERHYLSPPWRFWNDRCYRTIKAQHPSVKMDRTGVHHNAADDAESQARHLLAMLKQPNAEITGRTKA